MMKQKPELIDIRDAFFDELYEIASKDKDVIFLTADMGAWSLNRFRKDLPDQFINMGIAEQNMVSVATGLALGGKCVFIYSIVPFVTERCFEQIKIDLSVMKTPVTIVGAGPGLTYSSDGPTHHSLEDISLIRTLPGFEILNPCDQISAKAFARIAYKSASPLYVRLDKGIRPLIYNERSDFSKGIYQIKEGKDLLILATGIMTHNALILKEKLKAHSIEAGVVDMFRIKPLNKEEILKIAKTANAIITIEEHTLIGGIGSTVCEFLADEGVLIPIKRVGIKEERCDYYGDRDWYHSFYGLTVETVCSEIVDWCRKKESIQAAGEQYPCDLSIEEFSRMFGVTEGDLSDECTEAIQRTNFAYRIAEGKEHEALLLHALKELEKDLSISGPSRKLDWESGWKENLEDFNSSNYDPQKLIPKFVKRNTHCRFDGQYIFPENPDFETAFVTVLRVFLFKKYFSQFRYIYEFGCGTGHNLFQLSTLFPEKHLVGLDWAEASCEIIQQMAREHRLNLSSVLFDMFEPDYDVAIEPGCGVFTIGTLEQLGKKFDHFLDFLVSKKIGLCVNVETCYELYDQNSIFDYVAIKYLEKRNYLKGYLERLRDFEEKGQIIIIEARKTFGSFFHDGYSYIVWKPVL